MMVNPRAIYMRRFSRTNSIGLIFIFLSYANFSNAWDCVDCEKKCCTERIRITVCEPSCRNLCAAHNIGCGQLEIPTTPITPPVKAKIPEPGELIPTLLTGGLVNGASSKLTNDSIRELGVFINNVAKNVDKAGQDTSNELKRAGRQIETAGEAIKDYAETKTKGILDLTSHNLNRAREGKIIDALWHEGTDQFQVEDEAASKAAMKSELVRTVGQVTASVYGGPGGAAAYSAWLTYHQTGGNVELALRVGMITGATSWAIAETGQIPATDAQGHIVVSEAMKKVAVTGAIGGLAVAAAGGDESAVRDGFLRAGAMVIIKEGYQQYTKHSLTNESLKAAKGDPYCISTTVNCQEPPKGAAVYKNGKFVGWDQSKLDNSAPHVGTGYPDTQINEGNITWPSEGSPYMQAIAKVPGMNAMAVLHDQWAMNWNMPNGILQGTIVPAIVVTYNGTTAPLLEQIRMASIEEARYKSAERNNIAYIAKDELLAKPSIKRENVEASFLCSKGTETRSIILEIDPAKENFSCRVIYRADFRRSVPWNSKNDQNYCNAEVKKLANAQLDAGFVCVYGLATPRASSGTAAPAKPGGLDVSPI